MQPLPVSEQIFANRKAMIQFQGKTDKINPSFYWPDAVLEQCPTLGKYFLLHFHKYLCNSFWETCLLQKTKHAAPWHKFNCLFTHGRLWAFQIFTFLSQAFLSFRVLLSLPRDHIMSWAMELISGSGIWTSLMFFGELLFWAAEIRTKYNVLPGITLLSCLVIPFPFWFEAPFLKNQKSCKQLNRGLHG